MNSIDILHDMVDRVRDSANGLADRLSPAALNAHPAGHPNSVAWLLWHAGREADVQLSGLTGRAPVWTAGGFADIAGLGPAGDGMGFGQTPEQAARIRTDDAGPLLSYIAATCDAIDAYVDSLDESALDEIIDRNWNPPVSRGVRIISFINDAFAHVSQAQYVLGTDAVG